MTTAREPAESSHRFLIVGPAWVGDMVMTHSAIQVLADRRPGCEIDVLAPEWSLPLVERMAMVRRAVALPVGHGELGFARRRAIGRMLRSRQYDRAVVVPRTLKAALVPWFARIPRRTGYRGEMRYGLINDMRTLDEAAHPHFAQRCVALALEPGDRLPSPIPHPRLAVDPANASRLMALLGLDLSAPVVAMMPGAEYGPSKKWPAAHYAALARRFAADGFQVWLLGSARDRADADEIETRTGGLVRNLCGRTQLVDAVDLIAQARIAITNDSGLMHVAAAVGCAIVAMYGSTSPGYASPLSDRATVLFLNLSCSPCYARECPLVHHRCLEDLGPDLVHAAAREQLSRLDESRLTQVARELPGRRP